MGGGYSLASSEEDWNIPPGPPAQHVGVHSGKHVGEHEGLQAPGNAMCARGLGML